MRGALFHKVRHPFAKVFAGKALDHLGIGLTRVLGQALKRRVVLLALDHRHGARRDVVHQITRIGVRCGGQSLGRKHLVDQAHGLRLRGQHLAGRQQQIHRIGVAHNARQHPAQAVLGGFTVLTQLNPWFVGAHFVLSGVMIAFASLLVFRALPPKHVAVSRSVWLTANPIAVIGALTVLVGVLVTGAGPHSGDAESVRNGLDLELWQHLHSYPGYSLLVLALIQLGLLSKRDRSGLERSYQLKVSAWLVVVTIAQAIIGVVQARLGVPAVLVALHMLGASVLCSLLTLQWLAIRGKSAKAN